MKFILKYTGRTLFDSHLLLIVDATPFEVNSKCITFSISKTSLDPLRTSDFKKNISRA